MKIKSIACTQFAGIRDRSVSFADGINVVFGMNESGKSTLVDLISRTLFQNPRIDGRRDREFRERYFPVAGKGRAVVGDFVDGKITFDTPNGVYTLSKKWGAAPDCVLSTPDGAISDPVSVAAVLGEALNYGEGVYSDMLLSSQHFAGESLKSILDPSAKTDAKQQITDAVSRAFAQSDGISIDAIGQAIQERIAALEGKHWDTERNAPEKRNGRWSNGLGEVHKAYHALLDAREALEELQTAEEEADRAAEVLAEADADHAAAQAACELFSGFAGKLALQKERRKNADRLEKELNKLRQTLEEWPELAQNAERARTLLSARERRALLDKYSAARSISDELRTLTDSAEASPCPTDSEISRAKKAQRSISALENRLCGMNLHAAIKMLGGNTVEVVSLRTGLPVDISDGSAEINEAVKLTVPGVMEMQLSPADIDAGEITASIAEQRELLGGILGSYGVNSTEELEQLAKNLSEAAAKAENAAARLSVTLGDITLEQLEEQVRTIPEDIPEKAAIDRDILSLCGRTDPAGYIAAKEAILNGYTAEYGSIGEAKARAFDMDAELKKARAAVCVPEDIPEEFLGISDPEAHLASLKRAQESSRARQREALTERTAAVSRLEQLQSSSAEDPRESVQAAERAFEEQKTLLSRWLHIAEVFEEQKQRLHSEPMKDIAESFTRYLGAITGGSVTSEFPEADRLNVSVYSNDRPMDHRKLSEGTKETVSLAFRLAVLDHLFPDGGVIVLDDPFTDMDAERTTQSCELLRLCAKRHQVIFLTCREEYIPMLNGNTIRM